MNTYRLSSRLAALLFTMSFFLLSACQDEVIRTRTFRTSVPFYLSVADVRAQVSTVQAPQELSTPGKIYIYGNYLFITEVKKGGHKV